VLGYFPLNDAAESGTVDGNDTPSRARIKTNLRRGTAMPATGQLSDECEATILRNWFGNERTSAAARRIQTCEKAAELVARSVEDQLIISGYDHPTDWRAQRPIVIGYVNALSDALVKGNGETSRWATAFVALSALSGVLQAEWVESLACKEAETLWERRDAGYLAGIAAAKLDVTRVNEGDPDGLTRLLQDGEVDLAGPAFTRRRPASAQALAAACRRGQALTAAVYLNKTPEL
jgi:hypothetical protein